MAIKVSVLMPICNVDQFLRECLQSAVNQTLKEIEFICMDDGSSDNSPAILDEFAQKYPQIKAVHKGNEGYGISMNRALSLATGEYVGILESDDIASKDMFECLYTLAKSYDADAVRSNYYVYTSFPEPRDAKNFHMNDCHPYEAYCPREKPEIFFQPPAIWSGLYKRSFLAENNIDFTTTPGASYQDTAFNFKVWACANRITTTDRAFLHYRCDNENSSVKSKTKTYFVNHEMHEIEKFVDSRPDIKPELQTLIPAIKYKTYIWNLNRITPELRSEYFETIAKELKEDEADDLIDVKRFRKYDQEQATEFFANPEKFFRDNFSVTKAKHSILIFDDGTHGAAFKRTVSSLQRQPETSYEIFYLPLHPNYLRQEEVRQLRKLDAPITYVDPSDALEFAALSGEFISIVTPLHRFKKNSLSQIEEACEQQQNSSVSNGDQPSNIKDLLSAHLANAPLPAIAMPSAALAEIPISSLSLDCGLHLSAPQCNDVTALVKTAEAKTPASIRILAPLSSQYRKYHKHYSITLQAGAAIYARAGLEVDFRRNFSDKAAWLSEMFYSICDKLNAETKTELSPECFHLPSELASASSTNAEVSIVILDRGIPELTNESLASTLKQAAVNAEIICVTRDCSLLNQELLAQVKVLNVSPGLPTGEAWNQGLSCVTSPYVLLADGNGKFSSTKSIQLLLDAVKSSNSNVAAGIQNYNEVTTSEKLRANGNILNIWRSEISNCSYQEYQFDTGLSRILFKTEFLRNNSCSFNPSPCYSERVFIVDALSLAGEFHCIPDVSYELNGPKEFTSHASNMNTVKCLTKDLLLLLSKSKTHDLDWIHASAFDSFTRHSSDIENYLNSHDLVSMLAQAQAEVSLPLMKAQDRLNSSQTTLYPIVRIGDWLQWKDVKESRARNSLAQSKKEVKQLAQENAKLQAKLTLQATKQNEAKPSNSSKGIKRILKKIFK